LAPDDRDTPSIEDQGSIVVAGSESFDQHISEQFGPRESATDLPFRCEVHGDTYSERCGARLSDTGSDREAVLNRFLFLLPRESLPFRHVYARIAQQGVRKLFVVRDDRGEGALARKQVVPNTEHAAVSLYGQNAVALSDGNPEMRGRVPPQLAAGVLLELHHRGINAMNGEHFAAGEADAPPKQMRIHEEPIVPPHASGRKAS
jgi:hypothetical protein